MRKKAAHGQREREHPPLCGGRSAVRASAVSDALIARGADDDMLTIVGLGGSEPILDADGVEDKAASRRVEFVVTATE